MEISLKKILPWILRIGLFATLFAPLVYHQYFIFPYILPRAVYFQVIIGFLFALAVFLTVLAPEYRPKWTVISKAIVLFLAVNLLATIFSPDPVKSFVGTFERSFGFFNIIHFAALFFVAGVALRTQKQWHAFLWTSLIISLWAGVNFLIPAISNPNNIAPAVTGNQLFLAVYLLMHIFFAAYLFIRNKHPIVRFILGIIILIHIVTILFTGVRGAFVGLGASVIFLMAYSAYKLPRLRMVLIGALAALAIIYGFIFINRGEAWVRNTSVLSRVTNFSLADETIKARFAMWKMAVSGIKVRPILGWGRENYALVFNLHYDSSFHDAKVSENWEDRAHNIVFDALTTSGIAGLVSYILLIIAVFVSMYRILDKQSFAILSAFYIAYITQNLFGVDTLNSFLPLFMFFALIDFVKNAETHNEPVNHYQFKKASAIALASIAAITAISSITLSAQLARGNRTMIDAMAAIVNNDKAAFESSYKKANDILKYFPTLRMESMGILANNIFQQSEPLAKKGLYNTFALPIMNDLEVLTSNNTNEQRFALILGKLFTLTAIVNRDAKYLDKGDAVWVKLLAVTGNRELYSESLAESQKIRKLMAEAPTK